MNNNQNIQQLNQKLTPDNSEQSLPVSAELTIDLVTASVIGWLVYRATESSEWAWIVGFLIIVASFCKQGLKHFYHQLIRPSYLKSSPLVKSLWKTVPVCGLALIGSIRLFGVSTGLFVASVVTVVFTLILWLHESNLS